MQYINERFKAIKLIVSDIDGVLTDGSLFLDSEGKELFAKFNIMDGMGVRLANECGLRTVAISGRKSLCNEARCRNIGMLEVHTGIKDKAQLLLEISGRLNINLAQIAYIGDDVIDLKAMQIVGVAICPPNSCQAVKDAVDYITDTRGGHGALRELIELVLTSQGLYLEHLNQYYR